MRQFTKTMSLLAAASAMALTPAPADAAALNVGDGAGCGCSGGTACGTSRGCVCRAPGTSGGVWFRRMPDGSMVPGDPNIPTTAVPVPTLPPSSGRPENFPADEWDRYTANPFGGTECVPYASAIRDALMMTTIVSTEVEIAAGASADVDVSPAQGWFDGYYIDLALRTDTGAPVPAEGVAVTPPFVVGCPLNACAGSTARSGRFLQAQDGCCLGRPFRAIVPRTSEGQPLRVRVTNNTAADVHVQVALSGFCVSRSICV